MWFHTTKNKYMSLVAQDFLADHWWALVLPIALMTIIGCWYNPVFFMVLLAFVCLVLPLLVMLLYFSYSLTDEAIASIRPHTAEVSSGGDVKILFRPDPETARSYAPISVKANDIDTTEVNGDDLVIKLKNKPYRYITLPLSFEKFFSNQNS